MTNIDIIRMAKESGMAGLATTIVCEFSELERFATLVAAAEREACANLAQEFGENRPIVSRQPSALVIGRFEGEQAASSSISKLIRSRCQA